MKSTVKDGRYMHKTLYFVWKWRGARVTRVNRAEEGGIMKFLPKHT